MFKWDFFLVFESLITNKTEKVTVVVVNVINIKKSII